jgi:hypothetical protein
LDDHNGRFCKTPEYPAGIYCYFATVDANWNSAYPYAVGPYFYGIKSAAKVSSIPGSVTVYTTAATSIKQNAIDAFSINVYPNPANDFVAVQLGYLNKANVEVFMYDITGKFIQKTHIYQGSTIAYFDTKTLYTGEYIIKIINDNQEFTKKIILTK